MRTIVVGGGIVGLACARNLQKMGVDVTLIDPQPPGSQASAGNAGLIAGSAVVPEASAALLRRLPRMLLDRDGPLRVSVRHAPKMVRYARHVLRAAREAERERISKALAPLTLPAYDAWMRLLDDLPEARQLFRRDGCLYLYLTRDEQRAAEPANAMRRRRGMQLTEVNAAELRQLAPALALHSDDALHSPAGGWVANPQRLGELLAAALTRDGARILRDRVIGFATADSRVTAARTETGRHDADCVILAAGAWSARLAAQLGVDVPLDTERGYHLHLPLEPGAVNVPLLVPSMGVALTPMEGGVRVAGLVEFAGLEAPASEAMFGRLERRAARLFGEGAVRGAGRWMGRRPSLPDALPIIDRSPTYGNALLAFGNGQMGLTQAAVTAGAIGDLSQGGEPELDLAPYRALRFS
ncbi:FAD-binding oxidoreductase [Geminicoccaceae bacterium 1502E]|nr:FAD-binding oxidoreductase [Geminicoccaceae bacterium 1502E]